MTIRHSIQKFWLSRRAKVVKSPLKWNSAHTNGIESFWASLKRKPPLMGGIAILAVELWVIARVMLLIPLNFVEFELREIDAKLNKVDQKLKDIMADGLIEYDKVHKENMAYPKIWEEQLRFLTFRKELDDMKTSTNLIRCSSTLRRWGMEKLFAKAQ